MPGVGQANAASTQLVTKSQSLAAVQTLLRAGLSCIMYLRNLLPEDNFSKSHLTAADDSFMTSASETDGTPQSPSTRTRVSGMHIMTLTRGYTEEADRLLNYLENGIFDALQKRYLRSFIFAIYLDNNDPTNIVEAYTFNFKYHTIPGTDAVIPIMSLGEDLQKLSINGGKRSVDPVAEAIQMGRVPTMREVRKSVKTMIKTLIQAITHMDELPRRRFATFKLFYTDEAPADYEPPNFQAGDEQKDRWYFMTHNLEEVPDRFSVGTVNCGYHSVNVKVTSIATYLPGPTKDDNLPFTGTVPGTAIKGIERPRLTPKEEALVSARQAEEQQEDAHARSLVWPTEQDIDLCDPDADGEDDPDYVKAADGAFAPLGMRNKDGEIEAMPVQASSTETQQEAQFAGMSEQIPTRLKDMNEEEKLEGMSLAETQPLLETQPLSLEGQTHASFTFNLDKQPQKALSAAASLPPSNLAMELESPMSSVPPSPIVEYSRKSARLHQRQESIHQDMEMLNLETQVDDVDSQMMESIQSFSPKAPTAPTTDPIDDRASSLMAVVPPGPVKDVGLECDCNIKEEDEACFCEGECGRWYHVWCMGFHSTSDPRMPTKFICFDCRLKADVFSWTFIKESAYPRIMEKYRDFVTFRRAIKIAENSKAITPVDFAKSFDGDTSLARQLLKQLQEEEFIQLLTTTLDQFGMTIETRGTKAKGKDKKARARKSVQKTRYAFNKQIKSQQKYKDYFTPEQEVESKMLGLDDYRKFRNENDQYIAPRQPLAETQTQEETQLQTIREPIQKRVPESDDMERPLKKMKISVALGIDLAE
ncbi:hypothetical protein EST38_g5322 [Candolleomyces aberdarensis]|uniref:HORMA domain-containing protein n=1 Tax=Candolleomyces aberdarensis TaxID=2316362 RepID=A0A4Q2DNX1_9AGAR|nr:hypothetical protein EST38_g5322 [Candolleomyces aberdarensis]